LLRDVDADAAARHWAEVWERAWREHDADAIGELYADGAVFRSQPFREPHIGPAGAREYALSAFADEDSVECWFGQPVASGERAAVEYWAVITSAGEEETLAGTAILRFGPDGRVTEHRDYWAMQAGSRKPGEDWGR
jgi:ketosteroid isomerase-like protein